jgi:hypothetical protein
MLLRMTIRDQKISEFDVIAGPEGLNHIDVAVFGD